VSEPPLVEGEIAPELAEEWPGLRLASMTFPFAAGPSPPELRDQLRLLSDRFRGPQAIALRQQPVTQAYRIFFRHVGLEPDDRLVPVEALALERLKHGGFRSRSLLDDAMTIAIFETGVALLAFDGDRIELPLELRLARPGEVMGAAERPLSSGQIVIGDQERVVAVLFADRDPDRGVTTRTRRIVMAAIQVGGVPDIAIEECLWTVEEIVKGA
jgi:DNA/RNA-binding domain of Phe-tRNA-synthetase-like protein